MSHAHREEIAEDARRLENYARAPRTMALWSEANRVLGGLEGARRIAVELIVFGLGQEANAGREIAPDEERTLREVLGIAAEHGGEA